MSKKLLATVTLLMATTFTIGCGESASFSLVELKQLEEQVKEQVEEEKELEEPIIEDTKFSKPVNQAMDKAIVIEAEVKQKISLGEFDFDNLIDTDRLQELRGKLADGVGKLTGHLDRIKREINRVRQDVVDEMQYFDASNPDEKDALEQLQKIVDKLDHAVAKIDGAIHKVVDKLDSLNAKLDKLINRIDTGNAAGIVLRILIRKIKNEEVGNLKEILLATLLKS